MAKVYAPFKGYCGISASVVFTDGVGETSDPYLIEWFKARGYTVEKMTPEAPALTEKKPPARKQRLPLKKKRNDP